MASLHNKSKHLCSGKREATASLFQRGYETKRLNYRSSVVAGFKDASPSSLSASPVQSSERAAALRCSLCPTSFSVPWTVSLRARRSVALILCETSNESVQSILKCCFFLMCFLSFFFFCLEFSWLGSALAIKASLWSRESCIRLP